MKSFLHAFGGLAEMIVLALGLAMILFAVNVTL